MQQSRNLTIMSARNVAVPQALPSEKFVHLAQLHRLKKCQKVAAVCYRVGNRGIEFLLVQTGSGRWTFPKGSVEPGLSHAQAAALEAFEEAGVHGRIEEVAFTQYVRRSKGSRRGLVVNAHLCEVMRLEEPQETDRTPTWFSPRQAKRALQADRKAKDGAGMARVVDEAVLRIRRMCTEVTTTFSDSRSDGLYKVPFEAAEIEARMRGYLSKVMTGRKTALAVARPRPMLVENISKG